MRLALLAALLLASCDPDHDVLDAAGPDDVRHDDATDACFAFCQASGVVGVYIGCGKLVDAAASGACAGGAEPLLCPDDATAPFTCLAHATTTGTCEIALFFEDGGTYDGMTTITQTPPGCCGEILIATPSIIGVPSCDAGAD